MLAESGTYQAVYLNDLTIFYLRCRFASVDKGIHNKTTKYGLPTY